MGKRNDYFLHRGFQAEFRAAGEDEQKTGNVIEGLAAVYEKETVIKDPYGDFVEVIHTGAFEGCNFDDVRLLVNHDTNGIAMARSRRNTTSDKPETMKLWVDSSGLNIRADLDTVQNEQARALYSAIGRGDMDGMSFCFYVSESGEKWSRRDDGMEVREIYKVEKVIEVSVVNFPAYQGTNIDSRSVASDRRALENARRSLDNVGKPKKNVSLDILINYYKGEK